MKGKIQITTAFRTQNGSILVEAMAGFFVFIPLAMFAGDLLILFHAAQLNEEFAEQLGRLCSTLPDKTNCVQACRQVIVKYQCPPHVTDLELSDLQFDLGRLEVTLSTTMDVKMPIPFPGFTHQVLTASITQPIVSQPSPQ